MTEVSFFEPSYIPPVDLTYAVVAARHEKTWIFVRHRKRDTWEMPAGHIETNETPDEAAERELFEETGAREFSIECISTYSVTKDGKTGYGRLYLADISKLGKIPGSSEIAEITMHDSLPQNLTHPDIQPHLYQKILEHLDQKNRGSIT